jgi:hypothetical protein
MVVVGVGVLGEEDPQPLIVIVTPLSIARMAASVNSRRSSIGSRIGSVFTRSPRVAGAGSKLRADVELADSG